MRLGPLGFLAAVGSAALLWTASRIPVVIDGARADLAAVTAWHVRADDEYVVQLARLPLQPPTAARRAIDHNPPVVADRRKPLTPPARRAGAPTRALWHDEEEQRVAAVKMQVSASVETLQATLDAAPRTASSDPAFEAATAAYASLARGDRRDAARGFDAALAAAPAAPNAAAWRAEAGLLHKRWSGETFVLVRDAAPLDLGSAPVLGGGQSGRSVVFTPDPLMQRPLAVIARLNAAHLDGFGFGGIARGSIQGALGLRWRLLPGATVTVERLTGAREAWTVRAAGGATRRIGPVELDAYAEAGIVGARRGDSFASGQARALLALPAGFDIGAGAWASIQDADAIIRRVDAGPTIGWRLGAITARADYRVRIVGNAAPGSGPALTLSTNF